MQFAFTRLDVDPFHFFWREVNEPVRCLVRGFLPVVHCNVTDVLGLHVPDVVHRECARRVGGIGVFLLTVAQVTCNGKEIPAANSLAAARCWVSTVIECLLKSPATNQKLGLLFVIITDRPLGNHFQYCLLSHSGDHKMHSTAVNTCRQMHCTRIYTTICSVQLGGVSRRVCSCVCHETWNTGLSTKRWSEWWKAMIERDRWRFRRWPFVKECNWIVENTIETQTSTNLLEERKNRRVAEHAQKRTSPD